MRLHIHVCDIVYRYDLLIKFVKAVTSSCQYTGVSKALYGHMLACVYICLCVAFYTDMTCSSNSVNADTSQFLLRVGTKIRKAT